MARLTQIDPSDRAFFELIAQTTACNPFSDERAEFDAKIVGHRVEMFSEAHLPELAQAISRRVKNLERSGMERLNRYSGRDRQLMQTIFLFGLFHEFCGELDALTLEQAGLGTTSVPVKFAGDILARMARHGIGGVEAVRFFSIFYQLRRAYYFVARGLIGRSRCMREFRRHLWQNVFTQDVTLYEQQLWNRMEDFSTLLLGETGTGKGAAAAAIGRSGYIPFDPKRGCFTESFMRGFTALNLSQFPETLIESELFGHRKGAFTGAVEAHEGVLARCSPHGSIFLDEIGEVSGTVQIKLLQVLQERTFCPVGSHETVRFRGRVIAATNRPMEVLHSGKLFRDDFFYRLCSDVIHVPPLRQRLEEDPGELRQLVEHLLAGMMGEAGRELAAKIESAIRRDVGEDYPWPGNVRELEQAMRRILLTGSYAGRAAVKASSARDQLISAIDSEQISADELLGAYCQMLYEKYGSYEAVGRRARLDRRTVKKHLQPQARVTG